VQRDVTTETEIMERDRTPAGDGVTDERWNAGTAAGTPPRPREQEAKMARKKTAAPAKGGSDRLKALDVALANIEKDFGKGAVMRLGDEERPPIRAISSGNIAIDVALGIGGFPRGRIVEIYGPESSGKTTVALHMIAEAQKAGGIAAFVDAEHALDPDYARKLGVDTDNL